MVQPPMTAGLGVAAVPRAAGGAGEAESYLGPQGSRAALPRDAGGCGVGAVPGWVCRRGGRRDPPCGRDWGLGSLCPPQRYPGWAGGLCTALTSRGLKREGEP